MLLVGLTGGIGSGKSTVARLLAERGAIILDADVFAREAVAKGTEGFDAVVERFGPEVVGQDGDLDRAALAVRVFSDPDELRDLEAIVHPAVDRRIMQGIAAHAESDSVVVVDSPLLLESRLREMFPVIIVVSATQETQLARLEARGMDREDASRRMASQSTLEEKIPSADVVVDNEGSLASLEQQVDELWADLTSRLGSA